jgi:hypothetical protein
VSGCCSNTILKRKNNIRNKNHRAYFLLARIDFLVVRRQFSTMNKQGSYGRIVYKPNKIMLITSNNMAPR